MNVINKKEYNKKFDQVKKGQISEKEWREFCTRITFELMEKNQDVFHRLKHY